MTPPPERIRVLVADDTATMRLLLRRTLEASKAFEVVGEASDGAEAVELAASLQPDMVLLDLSMPVLGGLAAIPRIKSGAPGTRVVVLSGFSSDQMGSRAVAEGAAAFLEKEQRPDELVASLLQTWRSSQSPPTGTSGPVPEQPPGRDGFEYAPLPMAVAELDDRVLYANPAMRSLTGYGAEELGALTIADLTHPEDRESAARARRSVAAGDAPVATVDARLVRPDGRTVWASISASSAPDGAGGRCLMVQMVDITEQKRRECELTRSNAELSSFAFLAAHELKSPLQALSGFTALLERVHGPLLDPQAREFVAWIADGAGRMDALVEDLLAYCSVDIDETVLAPVFLDDVVAETLAQLDTDVTSRGAVVDVQRLPRISGDPVQLGQLLRNLLANALKFVPQGRRPEIHLSAERGPGAWTITVADNGIGIDDAASERIFAMFERLHPRERFKGTGIGLSICKRIVERRGGRIWVEPNPAGGSRFRFLVPDVLVHESALPAA